ncbi:hypothetical protein MMC30_009389 [Trapelia coarctata]|nr:hypothetical protein [Trapelia coarctata]
MYTKVFIMRESGWEDYTMLASWATYISYVGVSFVPLNGGAGIHQWDLYILPVIHSAEYLNIAEVLYVLAICLVKVSILLQIHRIFAPPRNTVLYVLIWGLVAINSLLYTAIGLVTIFQCTPRERIWNPLIPGTCVNEYAVFISGASMNLVSDLILLILPLHSVWKLQMKLKRKLQVSAVFATGVIACVSSLMRLIYSIQIFNSADSTWLWLPLALWWFVPLLPQLLLRSNPAYKDSSQAEITSGILCNCLPCMPRLFQHLSRARDSSTRGSTTYYVNTSNLLKKRSNPIITKSSHYVSIDEDKNASNASKHTEDWVPLTPVVTNSEATKADKAGV